MKEKLFWSTDENHEETYIGETFKMVRNTNFGRSWNLIKKENPLVIIDRDQYRSDLAERNNLELVVERE